MVYKNDRIWNEWENDWENEQFRLNKSDNEFWKSVQKVCREIYPHLLKEKLSH